MDLETLRKYCMAQPAVTEDIKWGNDLVFSVGGKMFCVCSLDPPFTFSFKLSDETYEELSVRDGFMPAPYMARAKWVLVTKTSVMNKNDWKNYIRNSYDLVKQKLTVKMRKELGI